MTDSSTSSRQYRRQRRAKKEPDFELAQPDRSGPKGKSLLDIAAERQAQLTGVDVRNLKAEHVEFPPGGGGAATRKGAAANADDDDAAEVPPWLTAGLYALTLSMVHFTLDVAVYHQYAQEIEWRAIVARLGTVVPAFAVIVYILHVHAVKRFAVPRQCLFLVFACVAGAYLVRTGNTQTYIAVMKRAPPLGALLIWSFVEMSLPFALVAFGAIAGYVWWNGFSVM